MILGQAIFATFETLNPSNVRERNRLNPKNETHPKSQQHVDSGFLQWFAN